MGLAAHGRSLPAALSGGMRQRAAIARTLYERQPIVLMDEPFSALDAITRAEIQSLAAELLAQNTVLLITHDPMEACRPEPPAAGAVAPAAGPRRYPQHQRATAARAG